MVQESSFQAYHLLELGISYLGRHHQVLENFYQALHRLVQETFIQVPHLWEQGTLYQEYILEYPAGLRYLSQRDLTHHHRQTMNSHKLLANPKMSPP